MCATYEISCRSTSTKEKFSPFLNNDYDGIERCQFKLYKYILELGEGSMILIVDEFLEKKEDENDE